MTGPELSHLRKAALSGDLPALSELAVWHDDRGETMLAEQCRVCLDSILPVEAWFDSFRGRGDGYGNGYGNGDGYGNGNGNGNGNGYGNGDGDGDGNGYGYGYGYGYGDGNGNGNGNGNGYYSNLKDGGIMPLVGFNQLIVLPHGWVICAFVAEQTGPFQFRVTDASVICSTDGVPWDELADGGRRDRAVYRKWGEVTIGPQFVMSRKWVGELPK